MVHVDVPRVRGKMAEKGYSITSLSKEIGVNRNTFAAYLDRPGKFPYEIVSKLALILCDTTEEATDIFLRTTFVKRKF